MEEAKKNVLQRAGRGARGLLVSGRYFRYSTDGKENKQQTLADNT